MRDKSDNGFHGLVLTALIATIDADTVHIAETRADHASIWTSKLHRRVWLDHYLCNVLYPSTNRHALLENM